MTLTVHHLGRSQSERIVWLCEELALDYTLVRYDRRADDRMAPPDYKALHPIGSAPVIRDGDVVLGESGAICDYLLHTRGAGRLRIAATAPGYADYLYWLHFANGTLQPLVLQLWQLQRVAPDHPATAATQRRFDRVFATLDHHLAAAPYLAGDAFTAADIMIVFSLTTMRRFFPYDLAPWPHIVAYLHRIAARPAYQRAMHAADPDVAPLLP